jgi:hypothetical protein
MNARFRQGKKFMKHTPYSAITRTFPMYSYFRAGCLLHMMTLVELVLLCIASANVALSLGEDSGIEVGYKLIVVSLLACLSVLSQLDARSRYQNYKQLKDQLFRYGFDTRILRPVLKSRCQRDAALVAAQELGFGDLCCRHFKSCGYRWYHLVPDFVSQRPSFLLSKYFWRTTFFMPTYQPRVDYNRLHFGGEPLSCLNNMAD